MQHVLIFMILGGFVFFQPQQALAQPDAYPFGQLDSLQRAERRPVVVYISTDWCRYCTRMKLTTLRDERVVKELSESFYFFSLNAEEKNDITVFGNTFKYRPTGNGTGMHALAEQLGYINGQLLFPTVCLLNADMEIIYQHGGYLSARELSTILALVKKEQMK